MIKILALKFICVNFLKTFEPLHYYTPLRKIKINIRVIRKENLLFKNIRQRLSVKNIKKYIY